LLAKAGNCVQTQNIPKNIGSLYFIVIHFIN